MKRVYENVTEEQRFKEQLVNRVWLAAGILCGVSCLVMLYNVYLMLSI